MCVGGVLEGGACDDAMDYYCLWVHWCMKFVAPFDLTEAFLEYGPTPSYLYRICGAFALAILEDI